MGYFPFFMEIEDKKGVVLGGGQVAARKVEKLLPFGPRLICIAPVICGRIESLAQGSDQLTLKCTFFFPALVQEGALTVGISSDGKCPAAASFIRKKVEKELPEGLGNTIEILGGLRERVLSEVADQKERAACLEKLFVFCREKAFQGKEEQVEAYMDQLLAERRGYWAEEKE